MLSQVSCLLKDDSEGADNFNELIDSKLLEDDDLLGDMIEDSPLLVHTNSDYNKQSSA